jgi:peptidoglycan/LPS O-acetylase OafA/YrhL
VLLVVLGHLTGWPRGGFVGVDVFFVISGYLITGLLVSERERTGRVSLRRFYLRRVRRLLPAGILVLAVSDAAAALLLVKARAHETVLDSFWALGFLANVHFAWLGTDYFSLTRAPSAVQHYWSLSVEEQFYLVWPCLLLAALAVQGRRALLVVVSLVVAASLAWSVVSTTSTPATAYFSSPARAWELGAGALLVLAGRRLPGWVAWVGGAGLVASAVLITPTTAVPGYALLLPVLSTVAVLGAGGDRLGLTLLPLRFVGQISYSLYLWHWPVIVLGGTLRGGATLLAKLGLLLLAGALSVASYYLVEQPFRAPKAHAARPRVLAPAAALAVVAALALAFVGTASPAAKARMPAPVSAEPGAPDPGNLAADIRSSLQQSSWPRGLDAELVDAGAPEWIHDKCLDVSAKNEARCVYGRSGGESVALLGDSVGVSWLPALRRAADRRGARIHVLTRRQCPNAIGVVSPSCAQHQQWAIATVQRIRPDVVVLSARYEGTATPQEWGAGMRQMIAAVTPYTKKVVVLAPPPDTANLQSCYTRSSQPRDCVRPVTDRWLSYAAAEKAAAQAGSADFVDPRPWLCADGECPALVDDVPVMFDGRHLAAAFAARLTPQLETLL